MSLVNNEKLWGTVLTGIEPQVSKANFSTWFKNTHIVKQESGCVYVGVPNEFVKEWLVNKYHKVILRSLRESAEYIRGVEYIVCKENHTGSSGHEQERRSVAIQQFNELPLNDLYINKEDNLNPRYTFDSFIIGPFNELAHAAAQAILKKPGVVYNPLFVYGGTGLGKTHLIQAVGNQIKTLYPGKKVYYITSEKFSVDYINSLQAQKVNQFKEKYRKYDVLIMDDIQFLANKQKFQEELFHLFNTLYDNNRQIIFSSDRHPSYIPTLEDRLRSRFGAGMIVDISQPDYESRFSILKAKTQTNGFILSDEIVDFLASSVEGSIRELEGVLNVVMCQTQLKNRDLSIPEVKSLIKNSVQPQKNVSVKDIVRMVANFYNIEEDSIYQKTRRKEVVKPRQIAMYLLREEFNVSFPTIGQKLGGRDHTTVIHSCEKIKNDIKKDIGLSHEIEKIKSMF